MNHNPTPTTLRRGHFLPAPISVLSVGVLPGLWPEPGDLGGGVGRGGRHHHLGMDSRTLAGLYQGERL